MVKYTLNLILGLLLVLGCQRNNTSDLNNEGDMLLKCYFYPTGMSSEVYLVKIFSDGKMEVTFGEKDIHEDNDVFSKIIKYESIILEDTNTKMINSFCKELMNFDDVRVQNIKKGGWEVLLISNGRKFHLYFGEISETPIDEIIDEIIKTSPIKIDLHSWS